MNARRPGLEIGLLHSRVARRIFTLFVLSALVPLAATAALTLFQVKTTLTDQSTRQLQQFSKNYGMAVLERLRLAERQLAEIARATASEGLSAAAAARLLEDQFSAVAQRAPDDRWVTLYGELPPPRPPATGRGAPRLWRQRGGTALFIHVDAGRPAGAVRARLRSDYLWGGAEQLPLETGVCMLSDGVQPLFCTPRLPQPELDRSAAQLQQNHSGSLRLNVDGQTYLAGYRHLNTSQFGHPGLMILSVRSQADTLAAVAAFQRTFPALIGVTLLLVTLLSFGQVRKRLLPLATLTRATSDFATTRAAVWQPVTVAGRDEFSDLAGAFNRMGQRIGRQLQALHALAQIDRVILGKPDQLKLARAVLGNAPALLSYDGAAFFIAGFNDSAAASGYWCLRGGDISAIDLSGIDVQPLFALQPLSCPLRSDDLPAAAVLGLRPLLDAGVDHLQPFPITFQGRSLGVIVFAQRRPLPLDDEDRARVVELADRLAVALSASCQAYELYRQANFDFLTGLPNRRLLSELLQLQLDGARNHDSLTALLYIDLDHFKHINDSVGHAAGDQLLIQAAARLRQCVRSNDIVARLGGDEFNIVLPRLRSTQQAQHVADAIVERLSEAFVIHAQEFYVSASIGISVFPFDGSSAGELMRKADTAMYQAKQAGRGRHAFFKDEMNDAALARIDLERELRAAVQQGDFVLYLQPQLNPTTGKISGAEALIRWQHPQRGLISPNVFIALAEENGLIEPIGAWALHAVCRLQAAWVADGFSLETVAVNVSGRQFQQPGFADLVNVVLSETGLPAECLELEITESLFIDDLEQTTRALNQLHAAGVKLAIDDFGTGYSSLSYLSRFPVDVLKIDRAFLDGVPDNARATALVHSIIAMAHRLGKKVTVEGVETEAQLAALSHSSCELLQGYHISRPLPVDEFYRFVQDYNSAASSAG